MSIGLRRVSISVGLAGWLSLAGTSCNLAPADEPARPNDGEVCVEDAECSSQTCLEESVCGHSECETELDCAEDWLCIERRIESKFHALDVLFGHNTYKTCMIHCVTGCPEHYACDTEGSQFCVPDWGWNIPRIEMSWSGAASGPDAPEGPYEYNVPVGAIVRFEATATSPAGAEITSWTWTLTSVANSGTPEQSEMTSTIEDSQVVEVSVPDGSDRIRVHVGVEDQNGRSGSIASVTLHACQGAGSVCADDGGCCAGCDAVSGLCL